MRISLAGKSRVHLGGCSVLTVTDFITTQTYDYWYNARKYLVVIELDTEQNHNRIQDSDHNHSCSGILLQCWQQRCYQNDCWSIQSAKDGLQQHTTALMSYKQPPKAKWQLILAIWHAPASFWMLTSIKLNLRTRAKQQIREPS